MAQPLFHHQGHGSRGKHMQHPIWMQADTRQRGRKEIIPLARPEHGAGQARQNARRHQRGGAAIAQPGARIGHFMQAREPQAAPRQMPIQHADPEGQNGAGRFQPPLPLQPGDIRSQALNGLIRLSHFLRSPDRRP